MKKFKPNIPSLKYGSDEKKKMISFRIPEPLIQELQDIAKKKGWTTTALIELVLDLYCQSENEQ